MITIFLFILVFCAAWSHDIPDMGKAIVIAAFLLAAGILNADWRGPE
jgi:hypothetical protein